MNTAVLASYVREVSRSIDVRPTPSDVPEERLSLLPLRKISRDRWGIDTIESYSLAQGSSCNPKSLWESPISCRRAPSLAPDVDFRYFLDGVQRTALLGVIPFRDLGGETVPLHLGQVGAAVLERRDRQLRPIPECEKIRFLMTAPQDFLRAKTNKENLRGWLSEESTGFPIEWVDTSYEVVPTEDADADTDTFEFDDYTFQRIPNEVLFSWLADPARFRHHARHWITRVRDRLERDVQSSVAEKIGSSGEGNLVLAIKDGSLRDEGGRFEQRAIGLVKSLRTQYLGTDPQAAVVRLPYAYRSPVFVLNRPSDLTGESIAEEAGTEPPKRRSKWLSWFVRIRRTTGGDPRFGLVRVEIDPSLVPSRGSRDAWHFEDSAIVASISAALVRESRPASYPQRTWGNQIYPVSMVEKYLRSRLLPHEVVRHFGFVSPHGGKS